MTRAEQTRVLAYLRTSKHLILGPEYLRWRIRVPLRTRHNAELRTHINLLLSPSLLFYTPGLPTLVVRNSSMCMLLITLNSSKHNKSEEFCNNKK